VTEVWACGCSTCPRPRPRAQVVVADGRVLDLCETCAHADLWRAMRVAGSSFGIATSLTIRVWEQPQPRTFMYATPRLSARDIVQLLTHGDGPHAFVASVSRYMQRTYLGVALKPRADGAHAIDGSRPSLHGRDSRPSWPAPYLSDEARRTGGLSNAFQEQPDDTSIAYAYAGHRWCGIHLVWEQRCPSSPRLLHQILDFTTRVPPKCWTTVSPTWWPPDGSTRDDHPKSVWGSQGSAGAAAGSASGATTPGSRRGNESGGMLMWDLLCPQEPTTCARLNAFEMRLIRTAESRCRPRLYVNLPFLEPGDALRAKAEHYFYDGDRAALERIKARWDPANLFTVTHGIRSAQTH